MRVYKLKLTDYNGPCVYDNIKELVEELELLLNEDSNCEITITSTEMSKEKLDSLPAFEGY